MSGKILVYNSEVDDKFISDSDKLCPAVQDYLLVEDAEDVARWRGRWFSSCRVCARERFCYASHQMQFSSPRCML